jgi:Holliday junction resolvasome RuvABC endonuclease subunit
VNVLGIDPSITATGIAVGNTLSVVGGDAILSDYRLERIHAVVADIARTHGVDLAVLEDLPTHAHGAGTTGMVQGVIRLALLSARVPYATVPPSVLKKFATGRGNADKSDLRMALFQRTGLDERNDNKVDAWWLRAAGMQYLGQPVVNLPAAQVSALDKVKWPALTEEQVS